jgi:pyrimidine operon attenuation protein/uracil phosphoribosyltransferase
MSVLLNDEEVRIAIEAMVNRICAELTMYDAPVIIGIKRRGFIIAERLKNRIKEQMNQDLPLGSLDISLYRDDQTEMADFPILNGSEIPFSLMKKDVILVDDILNSGRTALAALKAIMDMGRPSSVRFTTLLFNSTGREFPIVPDHFGKLISLERQERAVIYLKELDGKDSMEIVKVEEN